MPAALRGIFRCVLLSVHAVPYAAGRDAPGIIAGGSGRAGGKEYGMHSYSVGAKG